MTGRVILWRVREVGLPPGDDYLDRPHLLEPGLGFMDMIDLTAYLNLLYIAKIQTLNTHI